MHLFLSNFRIRLLFSYFFQVPNILPGSYIWNEFTFLFLQSVAKLCRECYFEVRTRKNSINTKMTILPKKKSSGASKASEHLHREPPGSQNPDFQLPHSSNQVKIIFFFLWNKQITMAANVMVQDDEVGKKSSFISKRFLGLITFPMFL